jgi:tRNA(Ile)-lysidine synthase
MANSRKSNSANFTDRVAAQIAPLLPAHSSILIGLSGGVDSVVLLHVLHTLAEGFCWKLSAVHVHHGISPHADAWAAFCADLCTTHHIPLLIEKVDITPLRAQGIEAAARQLRHAAFASQPCDFVALAHHADDQAETLLLQLLRGAGVRGASSMPIISAMPVISEPTGLPRRIRPFLHFSRQEILDYAEAHELQWIEDESNADDNYPRNFLRHRVLPLLGKKFPAYRDTLARSAQHFAEASGLLDELAQLDAARCCFAGIESAASKKPAALFFAWLWRADAPNRATGRYVAAAVPCAARCAGVHCLQWLAGAPLSRQDLCVARIG